MVITIEQINAHKCKVLGGRQIEQPVWEALSYWEQGTESYKSILNLQGGHGGRFPVGLYSYLYKKLVNQGHKVIFKPLSYPIINHKLITKLPGIHFEDYQRKMLAKIGPHHRGILVGPTGMGKTVVMGGIVAKLNTPKTLIITPTKDILNQTYTRFLNWFPDHDVGIVGDGNWFPGDITIGLFQSLKKVKLKNIQLVIVDEVHRMNNSINKILANLIITFYRYGVTATPQLEKDFAKWAVMIGNIGPIIHETADKEAIKRVTDVKVHLLRFVCARPLGGDYQDVLRNDVLFNTERCTKMLKAAKQLSLNKGGNCLILLDEIKHGKIMMEIAEDMGLKPIFAHGKNKNGQNEFIKNLLNRRKVQLVIATSVFGIGSDIPNIDCVGLGSARKSHIDTIQKIGRGRRRVKGIKEKLLVIDFIDNVRGRKNYHKHFYAHSIERLKTYKNKEWEVKKLFLI
jgi:superfamily II DNA or RNA helicase